MKFTKSANILSCAIVAAMASSFALADDTGWYVGGNVGQSRVDIDEVTIANTITPGFANTITGDDSKDVGYKLFGGYQFNRYFGLEFGYFNLGEFNFNSTTQPLGRFNSEMKISGINIDAVGYLPLSDNLSLFGRVGANNARVEDKFSSSGLTTLSQTRAEKTSTYPKAGVGVQYAFNEHLQLRVEAERYRFNNAVGNVDDADLYSVGLVYRFGSKPAPAPVVVTPPPAPAPAPVVEPPPAPKFEKFTMSATELFTFDSSAVNEAQPKLQQITTAIKGPGSPQKIVITGYTDRLGSDTYNQKLSERRAQAVKDYMIANGVAADRLVAEGKGEADPIVQCDDKNKTDLIKCLAPNRRVEIDEVKIVREVKP